MSDEHEREAEWRWGNTDAWRESQKRTQRYAPADWERLKREGQEMLLRFEALMRTGASSTSDDAMALAEMYREYNSRWFYETSHEMHAMLAQGYVADERFKKTFEDVAVGLAAFVSESIIANAKRAGANLSIDDALARVRAAMGAGGPAVDPIAVPAKHERRHERTAKRRR